MSPNWTGYAMGRRWQTAGERGGEVMAVGTGAGTLRPRQLVAVTFTRPDRPGEMSITLSDGVECIREEEGDTGRDHEGT